jgi:hypothetical protein
VLHTSTSFGQHLLLGVETSIGAKPHRNSGGGKSPI